MSNGFRQKPKQDKIKGLEVEVKNMQVALRLSQLFIQQLTKNIQAMENDINNSIGIINDLQYRTLAMLEQGKFDKVELESIAERLKLKDYNEASDKEDNEKGYFDVEEATEDTIVMITSTTGDENDKGIFRSKFKLSESRVPKLVEALKGKKVGDKVDVEINGLNHTVELLAVKSEPLPLPVDPETGKVNVHMEAEAVQQPEPPSQ